MFVFCLLQIGVSNMEGRGGHLFLAAPSGQQGEFGIYIHTHTQMFSPHMWCYLVTIIIALTNTLPIHNACGSFGSYATNKYISHLMFYIGSVCGKRERL